MNRYYSPTSPVLTEAHEMERGWYYVVCDRKNPGRYVEICAYRPTARRIAKLLNAGAK